MPGIIVGLDGSSASDQALEWAMKEAAIRRAPLTVITVVQPVIGYWSLAYYRECQALADQARMVAEEAVDKARAQLGDADPVSVTIQAVSGIAAGEILKAARNADLIVLGARGTGRLSKRLLGSVSSQVMQYARVPVVVIPAEDRLTPIKRPPRRRRRATGCGGRLRPRTIATAPASTAISGTATSGTATSGTATSGTAISGTVTSGTAISGR
jgi:nucleotide-binding universal stress UspA family protein